MPRVGVLPACRSASAATAVLATSLPLDSSRSPCRTYEVSPPSCPQPPSLPCTETNHLIPFSTATETESWAEEFFSETLVSAQMPIAMAAAPIKIARTLINLMIVSSPSHGTHLVHWTRPVPQKCPGFTSMPRRQFSGHSA